MKTIANNFSSKDRSSGFITFVMISSYLRLLVWLLRIEDKSPYVKLVARIRSLWKTNGPTFLVKYLKESTRLVYLNIAGSKVTSTDVIPMDLMRGLPKLIPGSLRLLMEDGDQVTIRAVLTILAIYKVILIPPKLKLETITSPSSGERTLPLFEIRRVLSDLKLKPELRVSDIWPSYKSGPNYPVSLLGLLSDAIALNNNLELLAAFKLFNSRWGNSDLVKYFDATIDWYQRFPVRLLGRGLLGRLATKIEAAGKVRVFAIVDGWTQLSLRGLHESMFNLLKQLPTDGTFDQLKPLNKLRDRLTYLPEKVYSFDLSAATDRFPIDFQVQVLSLLFGNEIANSWKTLMVNRNYHFKGEDYRYAVGQPMGALSSWAVFSFSHHICVQIAALRLSKQIPYTAYALLGDDIVISGEDVAKSYLYIMRDCLGVEINLSKSLISEKGICEFAKRLVSPTTDYSPIGPKNMLLCLKNPLNIPSLIKDAIDKGVDLTFDAIESMLLDRPVPLLSYQLKKNHNRREDILWTVVGPFGFVPTQVGLSASLKLENSLKYVFSDPLLDHLEQVRYEYALSDWVSAIKSYHDTLSILEKFGWSQDFSIFRGPVNSDIADPLSRAIYNSYVVSYIELLNNFPTKRTGILGPRDIKWSLDTEFLTNFYKTMLDYISSEIKAMVEFKGIQNPFEDPVVRPLTINRSRNFFRRLLELQKRGFNPYDKDISSFFK